MQNILFDYAINTSKKLRLFINTFRKCAKIVHGMHKDIAIADFVPRQCCRLIVLA